MSHSNIVPWNILKESLDVDKVEEALDIHPVSTTGGEDIAHCPLPSHGGYDKNPSFSINRAKKVFNCFSCGHGGSLIQLVMALRNVDYDDAIHWLSTFGDETDTTLFEQMTALLADPVVMDDTVLPVFSDTILDRFLPSTVIQYLGPDWISPVNRREHPGRGISAEMQDLFGVRYDPNHYRKLKNGEEYIGEAILIPHRFRGDLVGYQVGWIGEDKPKEIPKYTNSQSFPKAQTIFNYDRALQSPGQVYVVESAVTCLYLHSLGYSSIATFGASIQDEQIDLLLDFGDTLVLCYDNDQPGRNAMDKIVRRLGRSQLLECMFYPRFLAEKIDLNDLSPDEVETMLTRCVCPAGFWEGV